MQYSLVQGPIVTKANTPLTPSLPPCSAGLHAARVHSLQTCMKSRVPGLHTTFYDRYLVEKEGKEEDGAIGARIFSREGRERGGWSDRSKDI